MAFALLKQMSLKAVFSAAALLAVVGLSARGQYSYPNVYPPQGGVVSNWTAVSRGAQPYNGGSPQPLIPYQPPPYAGMSSGVPVPYQLQAPGCYPAQPMPFQPYMLPAHPCLPIPGQPTPPGQSAPPSETTRPPGTDTQPSPKPGDTPATPEQSRTPTDNQAQNQGQNQAPPDLPGEQGAATGTGDVAMAANMVGDLLGAINSVSFQYERSSGNVFLQGLGSASFISPKVAENNSPIPRDRVGFRYNFFSDAESITGDSGRTVYSPALGVSQANSAPRFQGITATNTFNVNQFTFDYEKTFLDGWGSFEVRLPFSYTIGASQNLSIANPVYGPDRLDATYDAGIVGTVPTPQSTLGAANMEVGNMMFVLKGLAYQSKSFYLSSGLAVQAPTARSTHIRVTDYLGDYNDNDVQVERVRDFVITNDTWGFSPFLAALAFPTKRWFVQGFGQVDIPLNDSRIIYDEIPLVNNEPTELPFQGLSVQQRIREQTLLNIDVGTGYYLLLRGPQEKALINAIAPSLEFHYTGTLNNADIVTLPIATKGANLVPVGPNGLPAVEPGPQVGNLRNRLNIADLTVASTFVIANRATVATGFAFPLTTGSNRTFDWEFQLQLNYYFGPGGFLYYRPRVAPNL